MKANPLLKIGFLISSVALLSNSQAQTPASGASRAGDSTVLEVENKVETLPFGAANWNPAQTNQSLKAKDRFRTGFKSRATLRLSNQGILRVSQLTTLEIQPPAEAGKEQSVLDLKSGTAYFFNRDQPVETQFKTPQASGAIRGTEFNLEVEENGKTVVTLLDGAVHLTNELGQVNLTSGEQGIVEPGQAPRKTAVIDAINIIQWSLYYPGVLDVEELGLSGADVPGLNESIAAYRTGDLLQAVASYPTNRTAASSKELVFAAALQLAVGQVKDAETMIAQIGNQDASLAPYGDALRQVIAAVKFQTWNRDKPPVTATEWMAESYYQQSRSELEPARQAARNAAEKSPNFGFAWARLAEMEFSFGRTSEALKALEKGLELSPRNAQALALRGFLLAAQNRIDQALPLFDQAIAIDGALGNAWLGRGLCRIRRGESDAGRQDLQVAATLEPHRAVLRSYLAKAYSNEGDLRRAALEIELAKRYDPNDPTAFLYSALLNQERNRINEGVRDLEKSQELNDNRSVFRSRLLLDQDRAVRSANLAGIYRDAGMPDLSVREASRAVNYDYGNYSAHLFLANSYVELLDQRRITLRYETAWLSEFLLANLLAPVGAGTLSQSVSQQEYSKLFERDRLGFSSSTEYLSRGDWLQSASQYGTFKNSSYSLDVNYRSETGERPNQDVEALTWWTTIKQQITPQDTIFLQTAYSDFEAGDVSQYYRQADADPAQRTTEKQEPNIFAGYHHEWSPGVHTLLLAGRLDDTFTLQNPTDAEYFELSKDAAGTVTGASGFGNRSQRFHSEFSGYSTELQQVWQQPKQTLILGGRYQIGSTDTTSSLGGRPAQIGIESDLQRINFYAYHQWQVFEPLRLTTGLTYDKLHFPLNAELAPITDREGEKERVSPKVGLLWSPREGTNLRGFYSRSLGGLFFDNSVRIEPVQIAGFTQGYRSLIPEALGGLVPGSVFELWGVALDHRFTSGTYVGVEGGILKSKAERGFGVYDLVGPFPFRSLPSITTQNLDFREKSLLLTVNQLVSKEWSLGATYRISEAELNSQFPSVPTAVSTRTGLFRDDDLTGVLNQIKLYSIYNHRCGFFSAFEALWLKQSNQGYTPDIPGDDFWHLNFFAGYRFPRRLAEVRLGILNLTDQDYELNPLNLYAELPRDRTFAARLRFNF